MKEQFEQYMAECPAVAILRGITNEEVPAICDALYEGGLRLLEIPLNSPNAIESIAIAARHCAGRQLVGAGTVLTVEDVNAVSKAGGCFIISPNTDCEVIKETKRLGMLSIPGFFTATEGFAAAKAGADVLIYRVGKGAAHRLVGGSAVLKEAGVVVILKEGHFA